MGEETTKTLNQKRQEAFEMGGKQRIDAQHSKGKLSARERIEQLLDPGTFVETGMFITHRSTNLGLDAAHPLGDGVITGWGKINDRLIYIYSQDFTVMGGSVGEAHGKKIARLMDLAYQSGAPLIGINDSGGARIQEGVDALAGYGDIFLRNVRNSGVIPQITIILGPCAGGAVYSPAITDFVFMVENISHMFITGPDVIEAVTHEKITAEELGGTGVHGKQSGVAHFSAPDEKAIFDQVRWLLSFLPANNLSPAPEPKFSDNPARLTDELENIVPVNPQVPYDVHQVIETIVDNGDFLEVQPDYASNLVIGFGRLNQTCVGIIANQADYLAGVLDINASDKGARFIRFCDSFHIPLITLIDTPGFLPGKDQEYGGVIRHGAKLIYAYAEATVPKLSIILRKAYGGAYIVMSSKHLEGDLNLAWPNAEIAVMGPEGAVNIIYRKEIANSDNPAQTRETLTCAYREEFSNPYIAASHGYIDDVIHPSETRLRLIQGLEALREKRRSAPSRKHGNIPL
jgi:acetyl-CoA carboxylase carboxyltransferase component